MKKILSKYGRHFWLFPLIVSLYSWYDLFFQERGETYFWL